MTLVAISGYARSGKDTVANILAESGFEYVYFADALRAVVYAANPWVHGWATWGVPQSMERLQVVIDAYGWDGYKVTPWGTEIRRFMQELGTEGCRKHLGPLVWIEAALNRMNPGKSYAVPDCRFANEAAAVRAKGGQVWRVNRPGVGPVNQHPSETDLDGFPFDVVIENDGSIDDLRRKVQGVIAGG